MNAEESVLVDAGLPGQYGPYNPRIYPICITSAFDHSFGGSIYKLRLATYTGSQPGYNISTQQLIHMLEPNGFHYAYKQSLLCLVL